MVDITIVNWGFVMVYKPTYNWGAPSCRMVVDFTIETMRDAWFHRAVPWLAIDQGLKVFHYLERCTPLQNHPTTVPILIIVILHRNDTKSHDFCVDCACLGAILPILRCFFPRLRVAVTIPNFKS